MKYPFLEKNELLLIDYIPGSSGQLLMRIWSEFDSTMNYDNVNLLSSNTITNHPASKEIDYDIQIPKRITNWFLNRCEPTSVYDYIQFFEFLSIFLVASSQRWVRGSGNQKFYDDENYAIQGNRILYGIHSWNAKIPYEEIRELGYNVKCISIVPTTDRGIRYQHDRFQLCYPHPEEIMHDYFINFNNKRPTQSVDLCTLLVDRNTDAIINWFRTSIGNNFRTDKIPYVNHLLDVYYSEVINNMDC